MIHFIHFVLLIAANAFAFEPNSALSSKLLDKELRAVIEARSTQDLEGAISNHGEIRTLRNECEVQLDRQRLPTFCFRVLTKEVKERFIDEKKFKDQQAWLDQLCVRRLKTARNRREIQKLLEESSVPRLCRSAAEERAADLKYTQESESPSRLFNERGHGTGESAQPLHIAP
jgi:hypothetical protein